MICGAEISEYREPPRGKRRLVCRRPAGHTRCHKGGGVLWERVDDRLVSRWSTRGKQAIRESSQ